MPRTPYAVVTLAVGLGLVASSAPSWGALLAGLALAFAFDRPAPASLKRWTSLVLQWGVIGLGAGMNLAVVLRVGAGGALLTALSLALTFGVGAILGRALRVPGDTSLLLTVGTAICGGSAIAAVGSVMKPKAHEMSVALGVVFLLNAVALVVFPPLGHAAGLSQESFGRWSALAIHDTSSVVGAARSYGPVALEVATTTKLARALWIVPLTLGIAFTRGRDDPGGLRGVKWPWFIAGFLVAAALFTWVPLLAVVKPFVAEAAKRLLVLALYLIGLSLSREALRAVGWRPLAQGGAPLDRRRQRLARLRPFLGMTQRTHSEVNPSRMHGGQARARVLDVAERHQEQKRPDRWIRARNGACSGSGHRAIRGRAPSGRARSRLEPGERCHAPRRRAQQ